MHLRFFIANQDLPELQIWVGTPQPKIDDIMQNDSSAINFARSLVAKYEHIKNQQYYRYLGDHKFFIDFEEKDPAMSQILQDHCLHGEYEPETTKLIEKEVKEGDVCIDIGASIGYFTLLFAKKVGMNGKVYAFEPTKNQFRYLKENIKANNYNIQVIAENMGAWSSETEIKLKVNAGNEQICSVMPLDLILPTKVDFIKLDVDGAEPEVLKGLEQTIKNNPQLKMVIEYYPAYIEKMGLNPQDVLDFLDKYFTYTKIDGDYGEGYWNYYCIQKNG